MNKDYAVVFAGGGTKGSYQVGVIKALKELKINITAVSGTSIGAINGALVVQGDEDKLENIYSNIRMQDVLKISEKRKISSNANILEPKNVFKLIEEYISNKGISNEPLKRILEDNIYLDKLYSSKIDFGLITYDTKKKKGIELYKEEIPRDKMIEYLLASSCFPIFKPQKIGDNKYLDGGLSNNMPISLLIKKGYSNIILIDVMGLGLIKRNKANDVFFKVIKPDEDVIGLFDFEHDNIMKSITLGYLDTLKAFNKLVGNYFYFPKEEFIKLLNDFTLKEIYGLEYAAKSYKMDRFRKYSSKEFLKELLSNYEEEVKNYRKLKKDIKNISNIKKIISEGYKFALIEDISNNYPSFLTTYKGLFSKYLDASRSLYILSKIYK